MAIVVVGGHSHNIGKTALACGLISAFRDLGWAAIKITRHSAGMCPVNGPACYCSADDHPYAIMREQDVKTGTDTSRFLAAGASVAFRVRVKPEGLAAAVPEIMQIIGASPFVLIESNSILQYLQPDLYLTVLDFDVEDWKQSARDFLDRADIAVVVGGDISKRAWKCISSDDLARLTMVRATPPNFATPELVERLRIPLARAPITRRD